LPNEQPSLVSCLPVGMAMYGSGPRAVV